MLLMLNTNRAISFPVKPADVRAYKDISARIRAHDRKIRAVYEPRGRLMTLIREPRLKIKPLFRKSKHTLLEII